MKIHYILTVLTIFLLSGCLEEEKVNSKVQIKVQMPEGFENVSPEGIDVKLTSSTSGLAYSSKCDASGIATFYVEYGFYDAAAQHRERGEYTIDIFNGRKGGLVLTANSNDELYTIELTHAKLQKLIIKEIYYATCRKSDGTIYTGGKDSYMSIYNNSDETVYLDSLCVGTVFPVNSKSQSNFIDYPWQFKDYMPIFMMAWQFPGSGEDYPLEPGKEVIIAINAIDHLSITPNSVDLSKADFAFWDPVLTAASVPAPGVELLNMIWRTSGTAFTFNMTGPAVVIFKIPTSVATSARAYADVPNNSQMDPVTQKGLKYLMIHKDWVIDGVECIEGPAAPYKRIINNVDAGSIYIPTQYLGLSVCRKVEEVIDGRTVYMDSNNSTEDFEVVPNTFKNR